VAQKRGFSFSISRHYDKVIVVVVLGALLASLFILARTVAKHKDQQRSYETGVRTMQPKFDHMASLPTAPYDALVQNLYRPETVQASATDSGLFVPQRRVWCVVCMKPIPITATNCPFCGSEQPLISNPTNELRDSEGKGIPDTWRTKYFNHPDARAEDHSRAQDDADGNGFSNLQKYQAGNDPHDPKDHPDLMEILHCKEIATKPYPFVFTGASIMPGGSFRLTFNMKGEDNRTYFTKKGDEIGKTGLFYSNCVQKTETVQDPIVGHKIVTRFEALLFRPADGKTFVLLDNDPHAMMEQEVVLTLSAFGKTTEYRASANGLLDLEDQKYRVAVNIGVDDKPISVVLENILTGRKSPPLSIGSGSP